MNLAALVLAAMVALAGSPMEAQVTGNGQQTVKLMPDTMEVTVNLEATDAQFDKALAAIQKKYAEVEKALRGLQSAPVNIRSDGPRFKTVTSDRQDWMLNLGDVTTSYMPSSVSGQPADNGEVTLSMTVMAKWRFTAREGLALLKETAALQEAVRAALPKPPEVGATEEQVEEMLAQARRTGQGEEPSGTPHFSFTAAPPADKVAEARAQAFKRARAQAESLAQAAGMKLGALRSLGGSGEPGSAPDLVQVPYIYSGGQIMFRDETGDVARSTQPGDLTYRARVTAEFSLVPAQ